MSTLARRLPAIRGLRSLRPAWLRHAAWFAGWWLAGFTAAVVLISL